MRRLLTSLRNPRALADRGKHGLVRGVRAALRRSADNALLGRLYRQLSLELGAAVDRDFYGASYFGFGTDSGASGYGGYSRRDSHADVAAYLLWRFFASTRHLEVGCALGYVVESLRGLGIDAKGCDFSAFALGRASPEVRPHLFYANLYERLPFGDGAFETLSAFETLEHLAPDKVPHAIGELARVSAGWVIATIPSFGPNGTGPAGWYEGKVLWERLAHYKSLPAEYEGPVPHEDLMRDAQGEPIQGHLTIASFSWWTARFREAGLVRRADVEREVQAQLRRFGVEGLWDLYVLQKAGATLTPLARPADEIARVEADLGLG